MPISGKTVTILNSRPGMLRAGVVHPAKATYPVERFTAAQLAMIEAEPAFAVIYQDDAAEAPSPAKARR